VFGRGRERARSFNTEAQRREWENISRRDAERESLSCLAMENMEIVERGVNGFNRVENVEDGEAGVSLRGSAYLCVRNKPGVYEPCRVVEL